MSEEMARMVVKNENYKMVGMDKELKPYQNKFMTFIGIVKVSMWLLHKGLLFPLLIPF